MSLAETPILKLTVDDIESVDSLMKRNSRTLGFLTLEALEGYLKKGDVVGIKSINGELLAYLLFATHRDYFRVTHLCVSEEFRGNGFARQFVEYLRDSATNQKFIRLTCRNDFPAHSMWPKLGFVVAGEKTGRSKEGHRLTIWHRKLARADQPELFRAAISDTVLDVVIDAQIFFDFNEPDTDVNQASKVLLSDPFVDSVNFWFTDELRNEINRNPDEYERKADWDRTAQFFQVNHDPLTADVFEESIKQILPSGKPSQLSDIRHLAKTAASEVKIFVTRDQRLLKNATWIADLAGIEVLSPTALILRLSELSEGGTYESDRVAGLGLVWRRLASNEFANFPFNQFLDREEPLRQLKGKAESLLVDTTHRELEVLWSEGEPIVLRGVRYDTEKTLTITLGRVTNSRVSLMGGGSLISDSVYKAMRQEVEMVRIKTSALPPSLMQGLSDMGFTTTGDHFVRFCFARHQNKEDTLAQIARLSPEAVHLYQGMTPLDLERSCSPLSSDANQNLFLIPIRPHYALNLFDRSQSARDMFGGKPDVLLLWRNVYYRSATHRNTLKAPGRILWYVSGRRRAIVAVSHLDKVKIDTPKELFRQFKKIGTLGWKDLYEMSGEETLRELMAIQFSHTFLFERPIALDSVRKVFGEEKVGFSVQSPRRLQPSTFRKLFELGYPERS